MFVGSELTIVELFASFIKEEILARQPGEAFQISKGCREILQKNLVLFLSYRTKRVNGAQPFLPNLIHNIVSRLMAIIGDTKNSTREDFTTSLCKYIVQEYDRASSIVLEPCARFTRKIASASTSGNNIGAATVIGNRKAFKILLERDEDSLLSKNELFGTPLSLAASLGNLSMVSYILECAIGTSFWTDTRKRNDLIGPAIEVAIEKKQTRVARYLLDKHYGHLGHNCLFPPTFANWLKFAVRGWDADTIKAILRLKPRSWHVGIVFFRVICDLKDSDLIQSFIEEGYNSLINRQKKFCNRTLLDEAVFKGSHEAVRALLDIGANPTSKLLQMAVREAHPEIARLLLKHGADPNPLFDESGVLVSQGRSGCKEINKMLRAAKKGVRPRPE